MRVAGGRLCLRRLSEPAALPHCQRNDLPVGVHADSKEHFHAWKAEARRVYLFATVLLPPTRNMIYY